MAQSKTRGGRIWEKRFAPANRSLSGGKSFLIQKQTEPEKEKGQEKAFQESLNEQLRIQNEEIEKVLLAQRQQLQEQASIIDELKAQLERREKLETLAKEEPGKASLDQDNSLNGLFVKAWQARSFRLNSNLPDKLPPYVSFHQHAARGISIPIKLGIEQSWQNISLPAIREFEEFASASENLSREQTALQTRGLSLSFSPAPKFWIQTAYRSGSMGTQQNYRFVVRYNKRNEVRNNDGSLSQDLSFARTTPYGQTVSQIRIRTSREAELAEEDLVVVQVEERLRMAYDQIPMGIAYHAGRGRLQAVFQAGLQWNQIRFTEYVVIPTIQSRVRGVSFDRARIEEENIPSTRFFSAYSGFGLNLSIWSFLHLRSDLAFFHSFLPNRDVRFASDGRGTRMLRLGLDYQF